MKKKIFIDGEEGTTGLEIYKKLSVHPEIQILRIKQKDRKDPVARQNLMELSDLTFLCLPDEASKQAVNIAKKAGANCPIIIDSSSAHRVSKDWLYGLPELSKKNNFLNAKKISVPGCYASGATVLINPLIKNSIVSKNSTFIINGISGYSGGGKKLINHFKNKNSEPFFYYGLNLNHKHLPEIKYHNKLKKTPIFLPSVANFYQGMIVSLPVHFELLNNNFKFKDVENAIRDQYANCKFVKIKSCNNSISNQGFFRPDKVINTNNLHINIFVNEKNNQMVLSSNFDNLGKGASSAAIQCMNLVFGFSEDLSLN